MSQQQQVQELPQVATTNVSRETFIVLHIDGVRYLFRAAVVDVVMSIILSPILTSENPLLKTLRLGLKAILRPNLEQIVTSMYRDILKQETPPIPRKVDPLLFLIESAKSVVLQFFSQKEWVAHVEQRSQTSYEVVSLSPYTDDSTGETGKGTGKDTNA